MTEGETLCYHEIARDNRDAYNNVLQYYFFVLVLTQSFDFHWARVREANLKIMGKYTKWFIKNR